MTGLSPLTSFLFVCFCSNVIGCISKYNMSTSSGTKVKATWTPELHEIFLDICLEQKLEGNKPGTYFTKEGWTNILELFYCKTGLSYEKKQLKNHWDISREQWKAWCKLVGTSSMKWDPETSTFGASDEDWTKYTQVPIWKGIKN